MNPAKLTWLATHHATDDVTGGIALGGDPVRGIYEVTESEGVNLGGDPTAIRGAEITPEGGIALGGDTTPAIGASITPTGGFSLGGETALGFAESVSANGVGIGGASAHGQSEVISAAGIALGGDPGAAAGGADQTGPGGFRLGGESSTYGAGEAPEADGLRFGGEAISGFGQVATGGVGVGGEADSARGVAEPEPEGGMALGGDTTPSVGVSATVDGGFAVGGAAPFGVGEPADGGLALGGEADEDGSLEGPITGGVGLGGEAASSFGYAAQASGVAFGGEAKAGGSVSNFTASGRHRGPTTLAEVLSAIRYQIARNGAYPSETFVHIVRDPAAFDEAGPGDNYAMIIDPGDKPDQSAIAGGGHKFDLRMADVTIRAYHRLDVDRTRTATRWTVDAQHGAIRQARRIANALHAIDLAYPLDDRLLSAEPMRAVAIPITTTAKKQGWGYVTVALQVKFLEDVEANVT